MNKLLAIVRNNFIIIFIILLATFLRFWQLGVTPPSLYWDEVSQGYNAYSILQTGYDEHHELLPITRFQAFGDYKAPVYIYLDGVSIAIFGKNELAIRFPSAFFGVLTVLLTFLLTKEIFYKEKSRDKISIFAAFFLAISPWHIQLSRAAYEANIATFFTILGLFLFFIGRRKNSLFYVLSIISLIVGFYAFNAHRIFIPLLVLMLVALYKTEILKNKKIVITTIILGFLLIFPFIIYLKSPESKLRFQEVNIFSDISVIKTANHLQQTDNNSLIGDILDNRRVLYGLLYVKHYLDFFDPTYLFFKGDVNPRFSTQSTGELYLFMLPLILIGAYGISKRDGKNKYFLFGWYLLAPLAAATARETPHALRSETFIPLYEIFASFGFSMILQYARKVSKKVTIVFLVFFSCVVIYYLVDFLHTYFVHFPRLYSEDWQYGYKQAVSEAESRKSMYDQIYFTNTYGRAYIYVLWYGKYSPEDYWENGQVDRDVFGFYNVHGFGKYTFTKPQQEKIAENKKILFIGGPDELPGNAHKIKDIKFLDGKVAFEIGDNQ